MKYAFKLTAASAVIFLFCFVFLPFGTYGTHVHVYEFAEEEKPNCTESGSEKYICSCGAVIVDVIPALGHSFKTSETPATCTQNGSITSTCKRCGYETVQQIKSLGHSFGEKYITDKKPTCTSSGSKSRHCTRCNKKTDVISIPALGHSFSKSKVLTKKASFSSAGEKAYVCKTCGAKKDKSTIYKVKSASLSGSSFTYSAKAVKPGVAVKDTLGQKLKAGRDYTVTYDKNTSSIGVHKVLIKFCGNYTSSKTLYYKIIPQNVSSIFSKSVKNGIELKWKAVSGGVKYRVYSYNSKTRKYKTLLNTSKNYCKVSAVPGTGYTLCVRAYKSVNEKNYYSKSLVSVKCALAPNPVKISVKALGDRNVKVSWNSVKCTGYQIYLKQSGDYTKVKTMLSGSENVYYKSSLKKGKTYTFKIRTYLKYGDKTYYSAFSAPVSVRVK